MPNRRISRILLLLSCVLQHCLTEECNSSSFVFSGGYLRYLGTLPELSVFTICRYVETDSNGFTLGVIQSYSTESQVNAFLGYGVEGDTGFDVHLNIGGYHHQVQVDAFPPNSEMFICQVFDTVEKKLYRYLNGIYGGAITINNANPLDGGGELLIGKSRNSSMKEYTGKIRNFMIWNKALTNNEITNIYKSNVCPEGAIVNIKYHNVQQFGTSIEQKECKGSDIVLKNSKDIVQYIEYTGSVPPLKSSTICAWVTTSVNGSIPGAVGTYAVGTKVNVISSIGEFVDGIPHLQVGVNGKYNYVKLILTANTEYNFCLVYDNMFSNKVFTYLNGELATEIQFESIGEIPGGGKIIIGQEQRCSGGCFDKDKAFNGKIRNFTIWPRLLSMKEMQDIASSNKCPIDDVVNFTSDNIVIHNVESEK